MSTRTFRSFQVFIAVVLAFVIAANPVLSHAARGDAQAKQANPLSLITSADGSSVISQDDIDDDVAALRDSYKKLDDIVKTLSVNDSKLSVNDPDAAAAQIVAAIDDSPIGFNDTSGAITADQILAKDEPGKDDILQSLNDTVAQIETALKSRYFSEQTDNPEVMKTKALLETYKTEITRLIKIQPDLADGKIDKLERSDIDLISRYYGENEADAILQVFNMDKFDVPTDANFDYTNMPFSDDGTPEIGGLTWLDCGGYMGWVKAMWENPDGSHGSISKAGGKKALAQTSTIKFSDIAKDKSVSGTPLQDGAKIQFAINVYWGKDSNWSSQFVAKFDVDVAVGFSTAGTIFKSPTPNVILTGTSDQVHTALSDKGKSIVKMIGLIVGAILIAIASAIVTVVTFGAASPTVALSDAAFGALIGTATGTVAAGISTALTIGTADQHIEDIDLSKQNKTRFRYNNEKQKFGIFAFEYVSTGYYMSCPVVHFKTSDGATHSGKANGGQWIRLGKASDVIYLNGFKATDGTTISDGDEVWLDAAVAASGKDRVSKDRFIYDAKSTTVAGYVAQGQTRTGDTENHLVGFGGVETVTKAMEPFVNAAKSEFLSAMIDLGLQIIGTVAGALSDVFEKISEVVGAILKGIELGLPFGEASGKVVELINEGKEISHPEEGSSAFDLATEEERQASAILKAERDAIDRAIAAQAAYIEKNIINKLSAAVDAAYPPDADGNSGDTDGKLSTPGALTKSGASAKSNAPTGPATSQADTGTGQVTPATNPTTPGITPATPDTSPTNPAVSPATPDNSPATPGTNPTTSKKPDYDWSKLFFSDDGNLPAKLQADYAGKGTVTIDGKTYLSAGQYAAILDLKPDDDLILTALSMRQDYIAANKNLSELKSRQSNLGQQLDALVNGDLKGFLTVDMALSFLLNESSDFQAETVNSYVGKTIWNISKAVVTGQDFSPDLIVKNDGSGKDNAKIAKYFDTALKNIDADSFKTLAEKILSADVYTKTNAFLQDLSDEQKDSLFDHIVNLINNAGDDSNADPDTLALFADFVEVCPEVMQMVFSAQETGSWVDDFTHAMQTGQAAPDQTNKLLFAVVYTNEFLTLIDNVIPFALNTMITDYNLDSAKSQGLYSLAVWSRVAIDTSGTGFALTLAAHGEIESAINIERAQLSNKAGESPSFITTDKKNGLYRIIYDSQNALAKTSYYQDKQNLQLIRNYALYELHKVATDGDDGSAADFSKILGGTVFDDLARIFNDIGNYESRNTHMGIADITPLKTNTTDGKITVCITANPASGAPVAENLHSAFTGGWKFLKTGKADDSLKEYYFAATLNQIKTAGEVNISVNYSGDTSLDACTASQTVDVGKIESSTKLSIDQNPIVGQSTLIVKADVSADGYIPTGTLEYSCNNKPAASVNLPDATAGQESVTVEIAIDDTFDIGGQTLTVNYSGDNAVGPSQAELQFEVQAAPSTIAVPVFESPIDVNTPTLELKGTVESQSSIAATGQMDFVFGDKFATAGAILENGAFDATFDLDDTALKSGTYPIAVSYSGDENTEPSRLELSVQVQKEASGMKLNVPDDPTIDDKALNFSVELTSATHKATGKIVWSIDGPDGYEDLENQEADIPTGQAAVSFAATGKIKVGQYKVTATYPGDAFVDTSADTQSFMVLADGSAIRLDPLPAGMHTDTTEVHISGAVMAKSEYIPSGKVNIKIEPPKDVQGGGSLDMALDEKGNFDAEIPAQCQHGGDYTLTVSYAGDEHFGTDMRSEELDIIGTFVTFNDNLNASDSINKREVAYAQFADLPGTPNEPKGKRLGAWYVLDDSGAIKKPWGFTTDHVKDDVTLTAEYSAAAPALSANVSVSDGSGSDAVFYSSDFAPYEKIKLVLNDDSHVLAQITADGQGQFSKKIKFTGDVQYGKNTVIAKTDSNDYGTTPVSSALDIYFKKPVPPTPPAPPAPPTPSDPAVTPTPGGTGTGTNDTPTGQGVIDHGNGNVDVKPDTGTNDTQTDQSVVNTGDGNVTPTDSVTNKPGIANNGALFVTPDVNAGNTDGNADGNTHQSKVIMIGILLILALGVLLFLHYRYRARIREDRKAESQTDSGGKE